MALEEKNNDASCGAGLVPKASGTPPPWLSKSLVCCSLCLAPDPCCPSDAVKFASFDSQTSKGPRSLIRAFTFTHGPPCTPSNLGHDDVLFLEVLAQKDSQISRLESTVAEQERQLSSAKTEAMHAQAAIAALEGDVQAHKSDAESLAQVAMGLGVGRGCSGCEGLGVVVGVVDMG